MNVEELRDYCLSVKGATESLPFDDKTLVFKVVGRMFAYIVLEPKDGVFKVDLKCDPEKSADLRERYEGVQGGTHTRHLTWNTVYIESDLSDSMIKELIDHSVDEVIKKLSKKKREEYLNS
ncbi:MmcQ/YjbR family DNA-binding protein [Prevotella sp. 10(H)]|uniref:MmcQ/YjbR family DNA-binding protein n=1 Tax=Prevotella sp. 10(H) TaxID=1158294 RepID=UPI0004A73042|nr:MmcQ/YjbR family DNA-binding protein [Prevotella sp. 10(H)]